jgi:hypothetical protein
MTIYLDKIQKPWSTDHIQAAIFDSFTDARKAIEKTPGGALWNSLLSLEDTRFIFEESVSDLLDEISLFADRSKNPAFWNRANSDQAEIHQRNVKRSLFYSTSALMALVDHARNFEHTYPVDGYIDKRSEAFTTPNLHAFLQDLRNFNSHWRIAEANWEISTDFQTKTRMARFLVSKEELLAWNKWNADARRFIEETGEKLDIYDLFKTYRKHVADFYEWHKGRVVDQYSSAIREYLAYKRDYEGITKKYHWNLIISHAPKDINPYQYLDRYLTAQQLEMILALPHRSKEQVHAIIQAFDMDGYCDDKLREKIEKIFINNESEG